nr:E2/UBC family protein [Allomuricauda sp.]
MTEVFEKIRSDTYIQLKKALDDEISNVSDKENATFLGSERFCEIWKIETGLYDDESSVWLVEELTMFVALSSQFPLEPAKIFYSKNDFENIGHIPHTSFLGNDVCVFDEFVLVDETNPTGIILEQLSKAKETLIQGIKGKNDSDFYEEFLAYWNTSGNAKDKLLKETIYCLVDKKPKNYDSLSLLTYSTKISNKEEILSGILFNKEEDLIAPYREYFGESPNEYKVFYIDNINGIEHPPFSLNCGDTLGLIEPDKQKKFKDYFNKNRERVVVFSKELQGTTYFLGWFYPKVDNQIKGFRKNGLTPFRLTFQKTLPGHAKYVKRFDTEILTENRLIKRTASEVQEALDYKLLIAGLGSVGSNLTGLLNNLNNPEFTLVDNDKLSSENIKRHLLGFYYLNQNKAAAVKNNLKQKLPSQKIHISETSIFDYYNANRDWFNQQDFIFLCLGKLNLEKWFIKEIAKGNLEKPTFILWVEPYLLGGQLLYFHPDNLPDLDDLFRDIYKYKFSIIEHDEFEKKRDLFVLKESGCQTTYSPYSSAHLSLFLTSVYPKIIEIIENRPSDSLFFSWIGDLSIAEKLDIKLRSNSFNSYTLIQN